MKKIMKLMTLAMVAIMLISALMIFTSAVDCIVYDAATVMANGTVSDNFKAQLLKDETGDFVKVTATQAGNKTYFRFDPVKNDLLDADFKPAFKFSDYPVMVIKYRTNLSATADETAVNAGLLNGKTGEYERYWGMKGTIVNDGQWRKLIKDLRTTTNSEQKGSPKDISSESGVRYIRVPIWVYSSGATDIKTEYFDIQWIGFFKSVEDAEIYGGKDPEPKKYVITYKHEDGSIIKTEEIPEKAVYTVISAPELADKKFTGWKNQAGELVNGGSVTAIADESYTAIYEIDLEKIAARERKEAIAEGKKTGKTETHKPFIKGYDGFMFKPDNNMTRAEAVTVITRLLVDEASIKGKNTSAFTDVEKGAWYYDNVAYLESLGYLKSYSGKFEPNKNITRAEFVELVYAMGKVQADPNNTPTFSDVPATHPRYEVIMAGASAGLVSGRPGGIFDPDGTIKRSEVVKVIGAALGRNPVKASFDDVIVAGFNDITPAHWAYPYVIESAFEHTTVPNKDGSEIWLTVKDENNYLTEVPSGLIEQLDAEFDRRKNEILNTKSEWTVAPGGTVWYVSYSEGANTNDGKSAKTPLKTLNKIMRMQDDGTIKSGDVVLFKRGDEWHDKFEAAEGLTYSAYGEGAKPRLLASTEADDAEDWKTTEVEGVYVFKYAIKADKDVGNIVFNDGECYGMRVLPSNGKTLPTGSDDIVSNGINKWLFPPRDFKGIETLAEIANDIPEADLMYWHDREGSKVYLYSRTGNPGDRFDSIELCTKGHNIAISSGVDNVTIDNLCLRYTGSHGIGAGSVKNLTVRNCEVGWIGGSIQSNKITETSRYGNAIEIYGSADGFYVYNNYCYQCFDCGPTVQWSGTLKFGESVIEKDVWFYDNVLREASLEVWLSTSQENDANVHAELINCRMFNNMVTGSGSGWKAYNHQKYEWCSFYGAGATKAPYTECYIENNYFWDEARHLMKSVPTSTLEDNGFVWRGNVIIHPYGEGSIGFLGEKPAEATGGYTQYFYDEDTVNMLVKTGAFGVNKFYYTDGKSANKRLAKDQATKWYDPATKTIKPIA